VLAANWPRSLIELSRAFTPAMSKYWRIATIDTGMLLSRITRMARVRMPGLPARTRTARYRARWNTGTSSDAKSDVPVVCDAFRA
jgi:hypothetical protein